MAVVRISPGKELLTRLAKALKIDRPIRSLNLDCPIEGVVSVTIEFPMLNDDATEFISVLESYHVTKDEDGA